MVEIDTKTQVIPSTVKNLVPHSDNLNIFGFLTKQGIIRNNTMQISCDDQLSVFQTSNNSYELVKVNKDIDIRFKNLTNLNLDQFLPQNYMLSFLEKKFSEQQKFSAVDTYYDSLSSNIHYKLIMDLFEILILLILSFLLSRKYVKPEYFCFFKKIFFRLSNKNSKDTISTNNLPQIPSTLIDIKELREGIVRQLKKDLKLDNSSNETVCKNNYLSNSILKTSFLKTLLNGKKPSGLKQKPFNRHKILVSQSPLRIPHAALPQTTIDLESQLDCEPTHAPLFPRIPLSYSNHCELNSLGEIQALPTAPPFVYLPNVPQQSASVEYINNVKIKPEKNQGKIHIK